jgi:hypothetical protein
MPNSIISYALQSPCFLKQNNFYFLSKYYKNKLGFDITNWIHNYRRKRPNENASTLTNRGGSFI